MFDGRGRRVIFNIVKAFTGLWRKCLIPRTTCLQFIIDAFSLYTHARHFFYKRSRSESLLIISKRRVSAQILYRNEEVFVTRARGQWRFGRWKVFFVWVGPRDLTGIGWTYSLNLFWSIGDLIWLKCISIDNQIANFLLSLACNVKTHISTVFLIKRFLYF